MPLGITIDKATATQILKEQSAIAAVDEGPVEWHQRVDRLVAACGNGNRTFIAALGTAILARATNADVDVFALKAGDSERGYSARSLCQHVLAEHSHALSIDLGVSGREPLNNQPFFAEARITDRLPIKPAQRPALEQLLETLAALSRMSSEEGRDALRAFITRRRVERQVWIVDAEAASSFTIPEFAEVLERFVSQKSEGGRRAQACVAGMLDAAFGIDRVECGRINDPDRRFPNDVAVRHQDGQYVVSLEVRDKPMSSGDCLRAVIKAAECGVPHVGVVALQQRSEPLDLSEAVAESDRTGIRLQGFVDWEEFVDHASFWAGIRPSEFTATAAASILARLSQLEASEDAVAHWAGTIGGRAEDAHSKPTLQHDASEQRGPYLFRDEARDRP